MKKKQADSERLQAKTVYEIIRHEGEKEMRRPVNSLWWSGFAAGLAISSSLVAMGMLHVVLPEGGWRLPLGRLQLFTENTITPVLPIMADFSGGLLVRMLTLWGVVLAANLTGTFVVALFIKFIGFVTAEQLTAFYEIARHAILSGTAVDTMLLAIPAGFYVAALVWMLPSSKGFEIWVIVIMTYLIAIGGFAHVIVGSVEAFLLLLDGQIGFVRAFGGYLLPALVGNVIGGTALFSLLAYAQVREEID